MWTVHGRGNTDGDGRCLVEMLLLTVPLSSILAPRGSPNRRDAFGLLKHQAHPIRGSVVSNYSDPLHIATWSCHDGSWRMRLCLISPSAHYCVSSTRHMGLARISGTALMFLQRRMQGWRKMHIFDRDYSSARNSWANRRISCLWKIL